LWLDALDNTAIAAEVKNSFDLLVVDEFQDTSPIQLAIFLKMSKLVKDAVWVGDLKQSIYGFRNADPEMIKMLTHELRDKASLRTLEKSWRSVPNLVELTNAIFTPVFKKYVQNEKEISLIPERKSLGTSACSYETWELPGVNNSQNNYSLFFVRTPKWFQN
jgi:ATP-dependent exoDNAse (exonuclease V) beta subunit